MTYHASYFVLIERIPTNAHYHRVNGSFDRRVSFIFVLAKIDTGPTVINAAFKVVMPANRQTRQRDISCGNSKLISKSVHTFYSTGKSCTSALPLPKPFTMSPLSFTGKGASGPDSGPATGSRGPSGRMMAQCFSRRNFACNEIFLIQVRVELPLSSLLYDWSFEPHVK